MFKENHWQIRQEEVCRRYHYTTTSGRRDPIEASIVASSTTQEVPEESPTRKLAPLDPSLGYDSSTMTPLNHTVKLARRTAPPLEGTRKDSPKLPRIHFLETNPHWLNVRWKLMSMPYDMMYSSQYLNRISLGRRVYRAWTTSPMWRLPRC